MAEGGRTDLSQHVETYGGTVRRCVCRWRCILSNAAKSVDFKTRDDRVRGGHGGDCNGNES